MWYKLQQHINLISLVCSWHSKYSDDIIVTNVWLLFSWLNINVHMENTLIFICTSCTRNIILAQFSEIWQAVKLSETTSGDIILDCIIAWLFLCTATSLGLHLWPTLCLLSQFSFDNFGQIPPFFYHDNKTIPEVCFVFILVISHKL